jgi:hypothetical protein
MMGVITQAELAKSAPQVPDKPVEAPLSGNKAKADGTKGGDQEAK